MRAWRLVTPRFDTDALSGEGAARYGGRWNPVGLRVAYLADSLALATLELTVHLTGGRARFTAIEFDIPGRLVTPLATARLGRNWHDDETATQRLGEAWLRGGGSAVLTVPSALVDPRSGEGNVLVNPLAAGATRVREVQRIAIEIDERLS
jgi:RES domain-containing protein